MRLGERLIANDGYEVMLFPCEAMYLSEARDPDEHDVLALDFLPRNTQGQTITGMKCYAPFSGTIVYTGNDHNLILESDQVVHTPLGLKKMRVLVAHSWTAPTLGAHYTQGQEFYTTGNYGQSTAEHLHMEIAEATGSYFNQGGIGLNGAVHMWEGLYVNDTALLRPKNYNWIKWTSPAPHIRRKGSFLWVLYAKRLRNYKR